jgi:hypothetical protein
MSLRARPGGERTSPLGASGTAPHALLVTSLEDRDEKSESLRAEAASILGDRGTVQPTTFDPTTASCRCGSC